MVPSWDIEWGDVKKSVHKVIPKKGMLLLISKVSKLRFPWRRWITFWWVHSKWGMMVWVVGCWYPYLFHLFLLNLETKELLVACPCYGVLHISVSCTFSICYACYEKSLLHEKGYLIHIPFLMLLCNLIW